MKLIDERIVNLEGRMGERYAFIFEVQGKKCFKARENEFFILTKLTWANAVVIEHAETDEFARSNIFEDGDLFFMDELDENEMFNAMIQEIEEAFI